MKWEDIQHAINVCILVMKPQDFDEPRCKCEDNVDVTVLILGLNNGVLSLSITRKGRIVLNG